MARARNIKPSFFTNEILGTLDPIIGMTFIGLWCLADKEGRLEDRPLRIKAELFPYRDSLDVNGYLTVLERNGFIERYEVDGNRYIQVIAFAKHQCPHHTEKPKGYPSNPLSHNEQQDLTVTQPCIDGNSQVPTRSDSLIPDSLIQIKPTKSSALSLKTFLDKCDETGADAIPADDPIFDYAEKVGLSEDMLHLCWLEFKDIHLASGKRQKDWRATYRNAVRGNWYRLWFIGADGKAVATSQGRQAANVHGGQHVSA